VRTGAGELARRTGESIGGVLGTLDRIQVENQLSESNRQRKEILVRLADAIDREVDSTLYPSMRKQADEAMRGVSPKHPVARRAYQQALDTSSPQIDEMILASQAEREKDTFQANVAHMISKGNFKKARKSIKSPSGQFAYTKSQAQILIARTREGEKDVERQIGIQTMIGIGKTQVNLDDALDAILKTGLAAGFDKADINFAQQQVKDDFGRLAAAEKEGEDERVAAEDADLSKRMYADQNKTTTEQVHEANLPRTVRDPLLTSIRLRDKDIAEGKKIITSSLTRTRINLIKGSVTTGDLTVQQGINQFLTLEQDVKIEERGPVIDALFKAGEDSQDDTKRQNQTILTERGNKLRDAIERSQGVIQLIKDEEREFLIDLANDAVIELNDRFRGLDFTTNDIDAFNDSLMRKYVLSQQAVSRAVGLKNVLAKKTFTKQVDAMVTRIKNLKGNPFEQGLALDEGMRLGLVNEDGTPSTATRDPIKKDDSQFLDALLKRR